MPGLHARGSADTMVDVWMCILSQLLYTTYRSPQAMSLRLWSQNVLHKHNRCLFSHLSITGNPALPTGGSQNKELRDCFLTIPSPHTVSTHFIASLTQRRAEWFSREVLRVRKSAQASYLIWFCNAASKHRSKSACLLAAGLGLKRCTGKLFASSVGGHFPSKVKLC